MGELEGRAEVVEADVGGEGDLDPLYAAKSSREGEGTKGGPRHHGEGQAQYCHLDYRALAKLLVHFKQVLKIDLK